MARPCFHVTPPGFSEMRPARVPAFAKVSLAPRGFGEPQHRRSGDGFVRVGRERSRRNRYGCIDAHPRASMK